MVLLMAAHNGCVAESSNTIARKLFSLWHP
jgi:hypothetical protein